MSSFDVNNPKMNEDIKTTIEDTNKANQLARSILKLSRDSLLVRLRFMDLALNQLKMVMKPGSDIGTDS